MYKCIEKIDYSYAQIIKYNICFIYVYVCLCAIEVVFFEKKRGKLTG